MTYLKLKNECSKITLNPFCYVTYSLQTASIVMVCLLLLQVALLVATKSYHSLTLAGSTVVASLLAESFFRLAHKEKTRDPWSICLAQGLLTALLLPSSCSVYATFFLTLFSFMFCKFVFGNFSSSWVNCSVLTVAVVYFLDSSCFTEVAISIVDLQSKNPSLHLIQSGTVPILKLDSSLTSFLNENAFSHFSSMIPEGYVSFFWDNGCAIPAFRFNLLTIVSSLVLFSFGFVDTVIPAVFLCVYAALVRFFSPVFVSDLSFQGDILLALLTGGTLFCTTYLLQWYGSVPTTFWGKVFYGILAGVAAFFIVGCGTSSVGFVFLVLMMNAISPLIQKVEEELFCASLTKRFRFRLRGTGAKNAR